MSYRHLDYPATTPVDALGRAALDDLLDRGDLADWAPLARAITRDPHGRLADTVLELCRAHPMYGTSALWTAWIEQLRSRPAPPSTLEVLSLRELRTRRGLTQGAVAARLGISQSDVSKLERRTDVRVSTLRAYVVAVGGRLRLLAELADDQVEVAVAGEPTGPAPE